VSKRDALERARTELPEFGELFSDLEVNPLPQSLEVELRPGSRTPDVVEKVSEAAMLYPFVEDARYGREWVDKLFTLRRIGAATTAVLGSAFAMVAALIIGTALRIAVFARREEIYVMRLVGAKTASFAAPSSSRAPWPGFSAGCSRGVSPTRRIGGCTPSSSRWPGYPAGGCSWGWRRACAFGAVSSALAIRRHLREI
jgi:cell division transport system permease protein